MKIILPTALLLIACIFLASCASNKYTSETLPTSYLTFGSGGGIAGLVTEYLLCENGQLFRKSPGKKDFQVVKTKKSLGKSLYAQISQLPIKEIKHEKPGNRYFFISLLEETQAHNITWGDENPLKNEAVSKFYNELMELTKTIKEKDSKS